METGHVDAADGTPPYGDLHLAQPRTPLWHPFFEPKGLKRAAAWMGSAALGIGLSLNVSLVSVAQAQDSCARIQNELMSLHNGGGRTAQLRQSLAHQSQELSRARAAYDRFQCNFGASPQCGSIVAAINQMSANVDAMQRQLARAGGGRDGQRIAELERVFATQCGPGQRQSAPRPVEQALNPGNLLAAIFGVRSQPVYQARRQDPSAPILPRQRVRRGFDRPGEIIREPQPRFYGDTFRTMCVRESDGFYWPISFSTTRDRFDEDRGRCASMCPGTNVELFAYANPGGQVEDMINTLTGEPYTDQAYAFSYRDNFDPNNRCTPSSVGLEDLRLSPALAFAQSVNRTPTVPQPTPRPDMASDPETRALGNGETDFMALGAMTRPNSDGEQLVRVVGPTYGYFAN